MKLRPGDLVRVRALGLKEWANAAVELASDTDPSSVMLRLLEGEGLRVGRGVYLNFVPLIAPCLSHMLVCVHNQKRQALLLKVVPDREAGLTPSDHQSLNPCCISLSHTCRPPENTLDLGCSGSRIGFQTGLRIGHSTHFGVSPSMGIFM